jgi:hypothetical protein
MTGKKEQTNIHIVTKKGKCRKIYYYSHLRKNNWKITTEPMGTVGLKGQGKIVMANSAEVVVRRPLHLLSSSLSFSFPDPRIQRSLKSKPSDQTNLSFYDTHSQALVLSSRLNGSCKGELKCPPTSQTLFSSFV